MAREPVKMNSVTSAAGRVSNRAAYMRPGRDNSGSKALASALSSLGGSLDSVNKQVDRYQNAQRQAELEAAQKTQNEEVARLQLQGIKDAEQGVSARGSYMQDSPLYQAAYQEAHLETSMSKRLAQVERELDWNSYNQDVDNGHNRLQADLLGIGEDIMGGHSPELQAKFYTRYREWAKGKMAAQAEGARLTRLKNIGEDGAADLQSMMATGSSIEEIMSRVEEMNNLAAAGGAENPSQVGASAVMVAAELEGRTDLLKALVADKDHMKTFSADQRKAIQDKMQSLEREERSEAAYMESQQNKAFARAKGEAALSAMVAFAESPESGPAIAKNFKAQMMTLAQEDPRNAVTYLSLGDRMYSTMMPDPESIYEGDPGARVLAFIQAKKDMEYLGYSADLNNPETAEYVTSLLESVHPDDHNKVLTAFANASREDHPVLSTPEWKGQEEEIDLMTSQMTDLFKSIEGAGSFVETDAMGNSTLKKIAKLEARAAIRRGASVDEAVRIGFGEAASQTNLYLNLTKDLDPNERNAFITNLAATNGLSSMLYNNPEWDRFQLDNTAAAERLNVKQQQMGMIISGKTDPFGEATPDE